MNTGAEQSPRRESRKVLTGDILWSHATNPPFPQFAGNIVDMNKLGIGVVLGMQVRESSVLRVQAKGLWKGYRYLTVMWCSMIAPDTYKAGLIFDRPYSMPEWPEDASL